MAIEDTATDFELPQDNQIIFEDASVADIENMLEGEVELLPIQADTKVSRLPTVETVEMLEEEVPLKPIGENPVRSQRRSSGRYYRQRYGRRRYHCRQ